MTKQYWIYSIIIIILNTLLYFPSKNNNNNNNNTCSENIVPSEGCKTFIITPTASKFSEKLVICTSYYPDLYIFGHPSGKIMSC